MNGRGRKWRGCVVGLWGLIAILGTPARAHNCEGGEFSSTFALIQQAIFENHSCTNQICHGAAKAGGLDLRADVAYENLVDVSGQTAPAYKRVLAGQKNESLLWLNLAGKTYPNLWTAPVRAMPLDPLPALSANELEAVRVWIEKGAPKDGVIEGTAELLDACLPPPEPIEIKPLPPPAPGTGVQIRMPKWTLGAQSENEVCFASYYDVTDQVPAQFRGAGGTTFRYKRNDIRQDPLSHHLIVNLYTGESTPADPAWGTFRCRGGSKEGQECVPTELAFCGADGLCGADPVRSIACIGYGPPDSGVGINTRGFSGTQETAAAFAFAENVYAELPLKGVIMWNSHAFNLTDTAGKLEAWLNFDFAPPPEQQWAAEQIFDTSQIFKMEVPAFQTQEVCNIHTLPQYAHLFELSSHGHRHMKRWRTFVGAFRCDGGPNAGQPCDPIGPDPGTPELCPSARCTSLTWPRRGDCNFDHEVTVNEVISGVNIALESAAVDSCPEADVNHDGGVSIAELVTAVSTALNGQTGPVERAPQDASVYASFVYNDPIVKRFDPALVFSRPVGDERALTYCALYDNGFSDPTEVKRKSTSPRPPIPGFGGPCNQASHCTAGRVKDACKGTTQNSRDASCDSVAGMGDGQCDACTLRGGVTTEDEMFLKLGQYYVKTP